METTFGLFEDILANVDVSEEKEVKKKELDPLEEYIENVSEQINEIHSSLEPPELLLPNKKCKPSIQHHDFKFERKKYSRTDLIERLKNREELRKLPIQYEITKKHRLSQMIKRLI
ncbi:hypothetical protein N1I87_09675 [Bacillus sp. FSL W8-0102]|uniref:hypothetical protein n=1 Tax=Bacillus sp. FSL W8-0102 TaxID=2978205 RepID=UPI0030F54B6A